MSSYSWPSGKSRLSFFENAGHRRVARTFNHRWRSLPWTGHAVGRPINPNRGNSQRLVRVGAGFSTPRSTTGSDTKGRDWMATATSKHADREHRTAGRPLLLALSLSALAWGYFGFGG